MEVQSCKAHVKENLRLAVPIIAGQASHVVASMADNIMVGRLGSMPLAAASLTNQIFITIFLIGIGLSVGITPLVGAAYGSKQNDKLAELLKNGIYVGIMFAFSLFAVLIGLMPLMDYMGQNEQVVTMAKPYYFIVSLSIIPAVIFLLFKQFQEGMSITKPAMILLVSGNVLNVFLNWLLIYGNWGFPKLGLEGAGIATLIARLYMLAGMLLIMYKTSYVSQYMREIKTKAFSYITSKQIVKIGLPVGLQFTLEAGAFSAGAIIIGTIGPQELAAHQIAITLAGFTFMMVSGLGSASTVRLSTLAGAQKYVDVRKAGMSAFAMAMVFMAITSITFIALNRVLPSFFISEKEVIEIAAGLLVIGGLFQLADGLQVSVIGALRGLQDVKVPTIITVISYWLIQVPLGWILAIELGWGPNGVWFGYVFGLSAVSLLLLWRFHRVSKKLILNANR